MFGLSLLDPLLFIRLFFSDESSMNLEPGEKQKLFILDTSKKRLCCTGRKTGKTINIERFIIQTGITTYGRRVEGMVVTPKQTHMDQLIDRVEHRMRHEPL